MAQQTEAAARFPPRSVPSVFPKPSSFGSPCWGEATNLAFPKSKASNPRHAHSPQRVSCGVYVTECPLACKQKAQLELRGALGAARWPQRGPGALQAGAELSLSSATCCSRVLQFPSCEERLCRRRALLHSLLHLPQPPWPRASSFRLPAPRRLQAARDTGTPRRR